MDKLLLSRVLAAGGIGVLPTDTIYGIVGSALDKKSVARIYKLRRRNPKKPMVILIGSLEQLKLFGVRLDAQTKKLLKKLWPGKVSVILPCKSKKFTYLHRGTKTLAFRLPKPAWLQKLLRKIGPLVAPSANQEGKPPAKTIKEAKKYFGKLVDFYVDSGRIFSRPSKLIKLKNSKIVILRN